MFSNYSFSPSNILDINAVTGTLHKTHPKSFFKWFHANSQLSERFFCSEPKLNSCPVVILQVMLTEGNRVIAEIVYKDDYENAWKGSEQ